MTDAELKQLDITRLCRLVQKVQKFFDPNSRYLTTCFCGVTIMREEDYNSPKTALEFIEQTVQEKLDYLSQEPDYGSTDTTQAGPIKVQGQTKG